MAGRSGLVLLAAVAVVGLSVIRPLPADRLEHEPTTTQIDLNTATAGTLELLPGVGATSAQRIVEYREQHGPFRSVDELTAVHRVGEKVVERIRPWVYVESEPRRK